MLQVPENAMLNTSLAVYGTYVGMECLQGYYTKNHTQPYVIHCMQGEQWSRTLPPCSRKSLLRQDMLSCVTGTSNVTEY